MSLSSSYISACTNTNLNAAGPAGYIQQFGEPRILLCITSPLHTAETQVGMGWLYKPVGSQLTLLQRAEQVTNALYDNDPWPFLELLIASTGRYLSFPSDAAISLHPVRPPIVDYTIDRYVLEMERYAAVELAQSLIRDLAPVPEQAHIMDACRIINDPQWPEYVAVGIAMLCLSYRRARIINYLPEGSYRLMRHRILEIVDIDMTPDDPWLGCLYSNSEFDNIEPYLLGTEPFLPRHAKSLVGHAADYLMYPHNFDVMCDWSTTDQMLEWYRMQEVVTKLGNLGDAA